MTLLREPGLNERRCIARHQLGFYRGLVVAGLYSFSTEISLQLKDRASSLLDHIIRPLEQCVKEHPILRTIIIGADGERPSFHATSKLMISNHVRTWSLDTAVDISTTEKNGRKGNDAIETAMERIANEDFADVSAVPPWRVHFVQVQDSTVSAHLTKSLRTRYFVAYNYSHSHGDGSSGLAFHQTFSQALQRVGPQTSARLSDHDDDVLWTNDQSDNFLPPSLEDLSHLPLSWSFLLSSVASEFLPRLPNLPFWPSAAPTKPWTGGSIFYDEKNFKTAVQIISIDSSTVKSLLESCRSHGIKLTGLLDSFIAHGLISTFDFSSGHDGVSGAIAINLSKVLNLDPHQMGVMASVMSQTHGLSTKGHIERARVTTEKLAKAASTLQDQPVGLLRYAGSLRSWHLGKLGKVRDTSYEVSNIMAFDPDCNKHAAAGVVDSTKLDAKKIKQANICFENVFFAQPASVTGPALTFNVVSMKGGELNIAVSWQLGALGLEDVRDGEELAERDAVGLVCKSFKQSIQTFIGEN